MRIKLNSIFVDDQQKALDFYTGVLGFKKSEDVPVGEFRWITVASPEGVGAELSLEPNVNPAAKTYQEALFEQGIPITAFEVDDVEADYQTPGGSRRAVHHHPHGRRARDDCRIRGHLWQLDSALPAGVSVLFRGT